MNKIRIGDLKFGKEEKAALNRVINSGRISEGPEVRAFEEEYADWLGVKYCVVTSSGTAALMCGLAAMKVLGLLEDGSRVLVPALTFIATANAVKLCGLEPIFGDVDPVTMCLSPDAVYDNCYYCDAVLPVHFFGYAADMEAIKGAMMRGSIIEDACQAHGTTINGKKVGTFGLWSAFSFYMAHNIQAGELGIVATDSGDMARTVRQIKAHGRECACKVCTRRSATGCPFLSDHDPRFTHLYPGFNFKAMEFQAAIARCQLAKVDLNLHQRRENVQRLNWKLSLMMDKLMLPAYDESVTYMAYPLVLRNELSGKRNAVIRELERKGVECRPLFGCIPTQQPAYSHLKKQYEETLPWAEKYGRDGFYVGCHQYLSKDDIERIAKAIIETVRGV